jgi:hypothetical protein
VIWFNSEIPTTCEVRPTAGDPNLAAFWLAALTMPKEMSAAQSQEAMSTQKERMQRNASYQSQADRVNQSHPL